MPNRQALPSLFVLIAITILATVSSPRVHAQLQISGSANVWIPFLPDYKVGSLVNEGFPNALVQPDLFQDAQTDVGMQYILHGFYQFEGTRTMFESDWSFARIDGMSGAAAFNDPDPAAAPGGQSVWLAGLDGTSFLSTADGGNIGFRLDSDVTFMTKFTGLRDRFSLRSIGLGELWLGCGMNLMRIEQYFDIDALANDGTSAEFNEALDSNYFGGEIRSTWINEFGGIRSLLDVHCGLYKMDTAYIGNSVARNAGGAVVDNARRTITRTDTAFTVDVALRLEQAFSAILVRPSVGMKYISDVGTIQHPQTEGLAPVPVSIGTSDAFLLHAGLEFVY